MNGIVYTETIVHSAPAKLVAEAPYQIAIVVLDNGERVTGRIEGPAVKVGDPVEQLAQRDGVPWFRGFAS